MARRHEEEFRSLLDTAFDGVLVAEDGVVVEISDSLLAAGGYTRAEVLGRHVTDFVPQEIRRVVLERHATGADGRFETQILLRDGRVLDVEVVAKTYTRDGRRSRIIVLRDVTAQRAIEAQLRHAQHMQAMGRFASAIAHDFNNILMTVRGFAELLLHEVDDRHRADVVEIVKAATAGSGLTRQLLAYSRQEAPVLTTVDVHALLRMRDRMLRQLIGRDVDLVLNLVADHASVRADDSQLEQVIVNLVVNARDAMPQGGTIRITTRIVDVCAARARDLGSASPGRYVQLAITDTGAGMSDALQARIFEPFFTTKAPGRGTGLGLAIVRAIVEQHKGFLVVDSSMGVGSTFAVHLPAHDDALVL